LNIIIVIISIKAVPPLAFSNITNTLLQGTKTDRDVSTDYRKS